jgi:hypothetical protein
MSVPASSPSPSPSLPPLTSAAASVPTAPTTPLAEAKEGKLIIGNRTFIITILGRPGITYDVQALATKVLATLQHANLIGDGNSFAGANISKEGIKLEGKQAVETPQNSEFAQDYQDLKQIIDTAQTVHSVAQRALPSPSSLRQNRLPPLSPSRASTDDSMGDELPGTPRKGFSPEPTPFPSRRRASFDEDNGVDEGIAAAHEDDELHDAAYPASPLGHPSGSGKQGLEDEDFDLQVELREAQPSTLAKWQQKFTSAATPTGRHRTFNPNTPHIVRQIPSFHLRDQ